MNEILLNQGDKIVSKRTGKLLECYHIMPIYIGNRTVRYEYSFFDSGNKLKTFKQSNLQQMLEKAWSKL